MFVAAPLGCQSRLAAHAPAQLPSRTRALASSRTVSLPRPNSACPSRRSLHLLLCGCACRAPNCQNGSRAGKGRNPPIVAVADTRNVLGESSCTRAMTRLLRQQRSTTKSATRCSCSGHVCMSPAHCRGQCTPERVQPWVPVTLAWARSACRRHANHARKRGHLAACAGCNPCRVAGAGKASRTTTRNARAPSATCLSTRASTRDPTLEGRRLHRRHAILFLRVEGATPWRPTRPINAFRQPGGREEKSIQSPNTRPSLQRRTQRRGALFFTTRRNRPPATPTTSDRSIAHEPTRQRRHLQATPGDTHTTEHNAQVPTAVGRQVRPPPRERCRHLHCRKTERNRATSDHRARGCADCANKLRATTETPMCRAADRLVQTRVTM